MGDGLYSAAVIGAGPAGIFAARELALNSVQVALINRDIKPGGLAEYGIYPDKHRMKAGLRSQFRQVLALPNLEYFGNVKVGLQGELLLDDLQQAGFQAVLVTAGAQGTKRLGLPGEDLRGVVHAKDLVFHYNLLPPYSQKAFEIGRRVVVVGMGNVMLDITRYLASLPQVDEVVAVARRGPGEIKFSRGELEEVVRLLDVHDLEHEVERLTPLMRSLGENPEEFMGFIRLALEKARECDSQLHFTLRFLGSPRQIMGDADGKVCGLEVEENTLVLKEGEVTARSLGTTRVLPADTVVFAIGDSVDASLGLPVRDGRYVICPSPRFPVEGVSYEVCDEDNQCPWEGMFVAGWSRKASSGLVGVARRDGINGAKAVLDYLQTLTPLQMDALARLRQRLATAKQPIVTKEHLNRLEAVEQARALALGWEEFKFSTNLEMLQAVDLS